ncbi:unnamed protein product [Brassica oleracea var. botrytis]|uniref:(rape) hypothetical protein n=1 Tax=Brassica napus TaxID=3708 RepID=A0A816UPM8_BRANA|nr:unnamed protein product [Brassica napus]
MLPCETSRAQCACEGSKVGKRKYQELTNHGSFDAHMHPIDEIKLWHNLAEDKIVFPEVEFHFPRSTMEKKISFTSFDA